MLAVEALKVALTHSRVGEVKVAFSTDSSAGALFAVTFSVTAEGGMSHTVGSGT